MQIASLQKDKAHLYTYMQPSLGIVVLMLSCIPAAQFSPSVALRHLGVHAHTFPEASSHLAWVQTVDAPRHV